MHKRYSDSSKGDVPDLGAFLITGAKVEFSPAVKEVELKKEPEKRCLIILSPLIPETDQEARRIFLLNEFGDLILKYQKQAYLQIRDMLLRITDPEGRQILLDEFAQYKASLTL
ncbi:MAG: hypothetical protein KF865_12755 [Bdellovibrionaceae bacterium]|nr:hypothetical protein [Pseudobdellovibrionaceae bacterium]